MSFQKIPLPNIKLSDNVLWLISFFPHYTSSITAEAQYKIKRSLFVLNCCCCCCCFVLLGLLVYSLYIFLVLTYYFKRMNCLRSKGGCYVACEIIFIMILSNRILVTSFLTSSSNGGCNNPAVIRQTSKCSRTSGIRNKIISSSTTSSLASTSSPTDDDHYDLIHKYLMEYFQGDFDNYKQVVDDRKQNLLPREGGGHEHFHCTLVPITNSSRLAAFYFDGNPQRIFRFRYYQIMTRETKTKPVGDDKDGHHTGIEMKLHTLHPELEELLKSQSEDPICWPNLFQQFQPKDPTEDKVNLLPKCEISWSLEKDPIQHAYTKDVPEEDDNEELLNSLHAVMVYGEAIVNSTIVPGMAIRILDQLSLYPDVFYINDRGFDPSSGAYIYGNQRGVPYCLQRVAQFLPIVTSSNEDDQSIELQRKVTNKDLQWTIGPQWRSEKEYESKIDCIGGPSAGINKSRYTSKMSKGKD